MVERWPQKDVLFRFCLQKLKGSKIYWVDALKLTLNCLNVKVVYTPLIIASHSSKNNTYGRNIVVYTAY